MKDAAAIGIFIPSDEVGNHDCASPLIFGGPASPSGSGEAFLFLAARAPRKKQWEMRSCCRENGVSYIMVYSVEAAGPQPNYSLDTNGEDHLKTNKSSPYLGL